MFSPVRMIRCHSLTSLFSRLMIATNYLCTLSLTSLLHVSAVKAVGTASSPSVANRCLLLCSANHRLRVPLCMCACTAGLASSSRRKVVDSVQLQCQAWNAGYAIALPQSTRWETACLAADAVAMEAAEAWEPGALMLAACNRLSDRSISRWTPGRAGDASSLTGWR